VSKRYTVAEANRTIPYVDAIVRELQERYRVVKESGRLHNSLPSTEEVRRGSLKADIREAADRIRACLDELQAIGAELKDYELGLVDFPAELEGRPILLCWKIGEERIGFWHEVEGGYKARQPVPEDATDWPPAAAPDSPPPAKERPPRSPRRP